LAATGQITFDGTLKKIGGLKWKLMAAKSIGRTRIILPEENREDFYKLNEEERCNITPLFCSKFDDVFNYIFPDALNIS